MPTGIPDESEAPTSGPLTWNGSPRTTGKPLEHSNEAVIS